MEPTVIKGIGATVTFDGEQVTIKHRGLGTVSAFMSQILGVDLQEPSFMKGGRLRLVTTGASQRGMMPKHPWVVMFPKAQMAEFQALYRVLASRRPS